MSAARGSGEAHATIRSPSGTDLPPAMRSLVVGALVAFGWFVIAVGLRVVPVAPLRGVLYWLVSLVGSLFVLAGVARAWSPRATRLGDAIATVIFTRFAVMVLWIGAGSGERHFGGPGLSPGPVTIQVSHGPSVGRIAFTIAGALIALLAALAWRRVFRRRRSAGGHRTDVSPC